METLVTHKTDSHHTNQKYQCLLVDFLHDPTFHSEVKDNRLLKANWMPTEDQMLQINYGLLKQSSTYLPRLMDLVLSFDHQFQGVPRTFVASKARMVVDFM